MVIKTSASFSEFFFKHRIVILLIAILSMIIGSPFIDELFVHTIITDIFLSLVFIAGIYAISQKKKYIYIASILAAPMVISIWSAHLIRNIKLLVIGETCGIIYTVFVISLMIKFILNQKEITKEVIYAAIVIYMLMAIMWSFMYFILEYVYPNSFSFPNTDFSDVYKYLYFSFVTITTLGFGDVAPLTQKAGSLVILEAVTGQIYLVVVVAWLVGMHVSRRSR